MSEKNKKDETLSASKVYEILKSSAFQKKLYWDILSTIKEKVSYKYISEMTEKVVSQQIGVLENVDSEASSMTKKSIVAELCSLGYTQDTVFSKIVYMDMEKAVKAHTPFILNDLRNEGRISDENGSALENHKDSIENSATSNSPVKKTVPIAVLGKRKRGILKNETHIDDKKVNNVNHQDVMLNDVKEKKDLPKKKLGGRIKVLPNKTVSKPVASSPVKELTKENLSLLSATTSKASEDDVRNISKNPHQKDEKEKDVSDAESDISFASISSVHTSDLSSFDDEISLSSEDEEEEGKKKRLSLKELQEKLCQKRKSSSIVEKFNGIQKNSSESKKKPIDKVVKNKSEVNDISTDAKAKSTTESASSQSPDGKGLPKRARKPNSRYSSDTIIRTSIKIKERKKSFVSNTKDEIECGNEDSPKSKKLRIENATKTIPVNETKATDGGGGNIKNMKIPTEESSDQHKPHTAVRSLTSRRTAPLTLYSTAT